MVIALVGLSLIVLSLLLSPVYPMIKKMWTIPFNLLTAGIGSLLFAIFYFIIDVKGFKKWTLLFSVFGMNSITIYLLCKFVSFGRISNGLFGWIAIPFGEYSGIIIGRGVIIVQWALLYMMYKKKIFLRV
jgi:predicted acyltransferase